MITNSDGIDPQIAGGELRRRSRAIEQVLHSMLMNATLRAGVRCGLADAQSVDVQKTTVARPQLRKRRPLKTGEAFFRWGDGWWGSAKKLVVTLFNTSSVRIE